MLGGSKDAGCRAASGGLTPDALVTRGGPTYTAQMTGCLLEELRADRALYARFSGDLGTGGWTVSEASGNEPMRDVTAERLAHCQRRVAELDGRIVRLERTA